MKNIFVILILLFTVAQALASNRLAVGFSGTLDKGALGQEFRLSNDKAGLAYYASTFSFMDTQNYHRYTAFIKENGFYFGLAYGQLYYKTTYFLGGTAVEYNEDQIIPIIGIEKTFLPFLNNFEIRGYLQGGYLFSTLKNYYSPDPDYPDKPTNRLSLSAGISLVFIY